MKNYKHKKKVNLVEKYPPSEPCSCEVCLGYCARPGWWTVDEARRAIEAGYGARMMLEVAPDRAWGVLAPAFRGCEESIAVQEAAGNGCNFLNNNLCDLFGSGLQPLECRYCHHDRKGLGPKCHADIERDWHTPEGQRLVTQWTTSRKIMLPFLKQG